MAANLIDNAIKYTPDAGKIWIRLNANAEKATLEVQDTGIGIPSDEQHRIFERFYRVDKARSKRLGGTGLGLAIVRHVVTAMNGKVSVKSVPGSGSTFSVTLPLAADTDTTNVDVAWYLAWCGLTRGVDFEAVKAWTRRATALSASGDSQRWTVLDLQGVVLRRDGQLAQAGTYLERAWESSRMAKSGMAAYHFAQALCELDRLPLARAVLLEALEKDDTYWANARREPIFKRLGTEDGVEQLIEDAKKTFD